MCRLIWHSAEVKPYSGDAAIAVLLLYLGLRDSVSPFKFASEDRPTRAPESRLLILACVAAIVIWLLARYLPQTSIYRRFALMASNPPGPSLAGVPREFATSIDLTPGVEGVSLSILRPSGKARFRDQTVDVITEGEFIAPNTSIKVVGRDGMRVVVKAAS